MQHQELESRVILISAAESSALSSLRTVNKNPLEQLSREKRHTLPLYSNHVQAGFPSPADDHIEKNLDLNEYLIKRPSSTFLVRASGDSMQDVGIFSGDILIVDKSLTAKQGDIVVVAVDGDLTVKRLHQQDGQCLLVAENSDYTNIEVSPCQSLHIWGVVLHAVRMFQELSN